MKTPPKKWRRTLLVAHCDGGQMFQCLYCKADFETSSAPKGEVLCDGSRSEYGFKFCPYCGIEWEGEHDWGSYNVVRIKSKEFVDITWVIEKATGFLNKETGEYCYIDGGPLHWDEKHYYQNFSAIEIGRIFRDEKAAIESSPRMFNDLKDFIRLRVVKPNEVVNGYISKKYFHTRSRQWLKKK